MDRTTLTHIYRTKLSGGLTEDQDQLKVLLLLDELGQRLISQEQSRNRFQQFLSKFKKSPSKPKGLYIWGGVGRGKTFMMDLFFEWLPVEAKKRVHFHRFMSSIHRELHELKGTKDPLRQVASNLAKNTRVLCFDEFFVSDIGDAMILAEILGALFELGVVLVATSNVEPKNLYENGLQRSRFLPAIDLLETHTRVVEINHGTDYRLQVLKKHEVYRVIETVSPKDIDSDINQLVRDEVHRDSALEINDREIECVFQAEGIAGFTFASLCESARSTEDYIELSRLFHTVVLYNIPVLTAFSDSAVRRFINLIDEFYDRNVNMLFYAAEHISNLYNGHLLSMEFERTKSRILEMQSDTYLTKAHKN